MSDRENVLTVRLSDEELAALEAAVEEQKKKNPGHTVSKGDAIRRAIAQCYIPRARS